MKGSKICKEDHIYKVLEYVTRNRFKNIVYLYVSSIAFGLNPQEGVKNMFN